MKWNFDKPLENAALIDEYEQKIGYRFPEAFRRCVMEHDGGFPEEDAFDTEVAKEEDLNNFCSFRKDALDTIWDCNMADSYDECWEGIMEDYVEFARTSFGDLICFDRRDNTVVLVRHETLDVERTGKEFAAFMDSLYIPEDDDDLPLPPVVKKKESLLDKLARLFGQPCD